MQIFLSLRIWNQVEYGFPMVEKRLVFKWSEIQSLTIWNLHKWLPFWQRPFEIQTVPLFQMFGAIAIAWLFESCTIWNLIFKTQDFYDRIPDPLCSCFNFFTELSETSSNMFYNFPEIRGAVKMTYTELWKATLSKTLFENACRAALQTTCLPFCQTLEQLILSLCKIFPDFSKRQFAGLNSRGTWAIKLGIWQPCLTNFCQTWIDLKRDSHKALFSTEKKS